MDGADISPCPPNETTRALNVLFESLPADERRGLVASLAQALQDDPANHRGLLVARDEHDLTGAVFAQQQPGGTAVVWPPHSIPQNRELEQALARAADKFLAQRGTVMAQSLLSTREDRAVEVLEDIGLQYLTELKYMIREPSAVAAEHDRHELQFEPYEPSQRARLAELIEMTYVGTQDCPQLNGVRDMDDVITGYQATGVFDPAKWFFVKDGSRDVGVLLLAEHVPAQQWEVVYMALAPQARRRGFGGQIVQFALRRAWEVGAEGLLLAVDADNVAGLRLYRRCGFSIWNQRFVFWKHYQ